MARVIGDDRDLPIGDHHFLESDSEVHKCSKFIISHATVADKPILKGLSLAINAGEIHAIMGPERRGQVDAGLYARRPARLRSHRRLGDVRRAGPARPRAARTRRSGAVPRLPVSGRDPGRLVRAVPARGGQCAAQVAWRSAAVGRRVPQARAREGRSAAAGHGHAQAAGERRLLGRREEARRDGADGDSRSQARDPRRDRQRARHRCAADRAAKGSTRSCGSPTRRCC